MTVADASPADRKAATSGLMGVPLLDGPAVYDALDTSPDGLSTDQVAQRLARYGSNELPKKHGRPAYLQFLEQFTDLFAVMLMVASAITFLAYLLQQPRDPGHLELTIAILCVVLLNAVIGFFQEFSAERTAEALQAMIPKSSQVIRDGERVEVPARDLVPGDVVVLEAGDAISCDARLVEVHDLSVNNVALTGESKPLRRTDRASTSPRALVDHRNCVFMGTSVVNGTGTAVVLATGVRTEFGRIFELTTSVEVERSPLQRQVATMARRVSVVAVALGVLLFVLRRFTSTSSSFVDSFVFALGVMVAMVPEGLPATLSVSLAVGVRRMAARHALVKRLAAVDTLGSTTVICTDKTGTLTRAEMTVVSVWVAGSQHRVAGVGYVPEGTVEDPEPIREVLRVGALCADARLLGPTDDEGWRILGDTTEGAIIVAAAKAGIDLAAETARTPRVGEFPFDAVRKLMSTVHRVDTTFEVYVKGSPQELLARCTQVDLVDHVEDMTDDRRQEVVAANDAMAGDALRVLGVARRTVTNARPGEDEAENGLTFLGLVGMIDPPRTEAIEAVARCRAAGMRIIMVTGDYGLTAEAVARRVGIITGDRGRVISGTELAAMTDQELDAALAATLEVVFARVRPEDKLRVVGALQGSGEVVAVTGDGANDAPALKRADIGISMGLTGTDVAREASVMVLLDDSFASIAYAVELGRSVYQNIRKFLIYVFSHNIAELVPILAASFVGLPLVPITALQVLAIDLGSDVLPALALGTERPEAGVMDRPPRPTDEQLFSGPVIARFLFLGLIQAAGVTFAFFWKLDQAGIPLRQFTDASNAIYREALTMTQAGIVVSQCFNGLSVRTDEQSVFRVGLLANRPLLAAEGVAIGIMAAISYVPLLQRVFNTAPLSFTDWAMLTAFGAVLLVADEIRKAVLRANRRRTAEQPTP